MCICPVVYALVLLLYCIYCYARIMDGIVFHRILFVLAFVFMLCIRIFVMNSLPNLKIYSIYWIVSIVCTVVHCTVFVLDSV